VIWQVAAAQIAGIFPILRPIRFHTERSLILRKRDLTINVIDYQYR